MRSATEVIASTITRLVHAIDAKAWGAIPDLFTASVTTDYVSLFGGAPVTQRNTELVNGWHEALASVVTQHLLGPIDTIADNDTAKAECHVRAIHVAKGKPGGDEWVVYGHYTFELKREGDQWRIATMKLDTHLQTGNTKLLT